MPPGPRGYGRLTPQTGGGRRLGYILLTQGQWLGKPSLRRCQRSDQRSSAADPAPTFDKDGVTVTYKAEYIWIDGTTPTAKLRSKTRILADGAELPIWGFDGSSTNQAEGHASDRVLKPVASFPDPIRGGDDVLVLCEVFNIDGTPHESNTRAALREVAEKYAGQESLFGIEQEYTFFQGSRPLGFPENGFPAPQGGYYCGVGADEIFGRPVVEKHLENCLAAGIGVSGINAEVMPGQWEFQVGPLSPLEVSDHLWVARWLLYRTAEDFGISATLDPKPAKGDWNGAGAHTNFSTKAMREDYAAIIEACEALGRDDKPLEHIKHYGAGVEARLTGAHETAPWNEYSYGVSNRGASVRIPWQVEVDQKGYIEDRRPNANVDPYVVTRLIVDTCCTALEKAGLV
jgi:glutamine synthetase